MTSSKASKPSTKKKAKPTIILCGLAGSGKSTCAKLLAKRFKIRHVSAGDIFRAIAKERGLDLMELGRYAEKHPEFDKDLDERLISEAKKGSVVLDGRAVCFLAKKKRIPSLKVWLAVDPKISAERVSKRDGLTVKEAGQNSRKREREVAKRLKALWGLDTSNLKYYDIVIQTDNYTPKEVVDIISQLARYDRA